MTVLSTRDDFMPASKDTTQGQITGSFPFSNSIDVDQWCHSVPFGGPGFLPLSPPDSASNCTVMDHEETGAWNGSSLQDHEWGAGKLNSDEAIHVTGPDEIWPAYDPSLQHQDAHAPNTISWTEETHGSVDFGLSPVLSYQSHNSHGLSSYTTSDLGSIPPGLDLSFIEPAWHVSDPSEAPGHNLHMDAKLPSETFSPTAHYAAPWTSDGPHGNGTDAVLRPSQHASVVGMDQSSHVASALESSHGEMNETSGSSMYPYNAASSVQVAQMPQRAVHPVSQLQGTPVSQTQNPGSGIAGNDDLSYSANVPVIHVVASASPVPQRRYVSLAPTPSVPASGLHPVSQRTVPPMSVGPDSHAALYKTHMTSQRGESVPGPTMHRGSIFSDDSHASHGEDQFSDRRSSFGQQQQDLMFSSAGTLLTSPHPADNSRIHIAEGSSTHEAEEGRHRNHPLYAKGPEDDGLYRCPFAAESNCQHKATKLKCNYDKFIDSHLKPFRCKSDACSKLEFSSTACLLRHEREAHGMHGHGNRPHLCKYHGCDRAQADNGFPRRYNLYDHMKRVHNHQVEKEAESSHHETRKPAVSRKRKESGTVLSEPGPKHIKQALSPPLPPHALLPPPPQQQRPQQVTLVGGLASPPMAHLELGYSHQRHPNHSAKTTHERNAIYQQWAKTREHLARSVDNMQSPDDEDHLQKLSDEIAELRRLSEEARHG